MTPKSPSGFHNLHWLWLSALTVALDQISKYCLRRALPLYGEQPLLPHLNLVHVRNNGAAFSMLRQLPPIGFVMLSLAVCAAIGFWLWNHARGDRFVAAGLALILGGALGNAIDRMLQGFVTDFVDFYIGDWHFAAFNLADSAITLGAGLLLLDLFLSRRKQ